jgi:hypothetical protein
MNRRGFLKIGAAAVAAPWVITKAGVLMPVKKVWTAENVSFVQSGTGATSMTLQGLVGQRMVIHNDGTGYLILDGITGPFRTQTLTVSRHIAPKETAMFVYDGSKWLETSRA